MARLAMAIGPYLYGARSQKLPDRWHEGNAVLYSAARYSRTLTLARMGILPFFVLASTIVWLWGRRILGEWGGLAPVFVFTNLPPQRLLTLALDTRESWLTQPIKTTYDLDNIKLQDLAASESTLQAVFELEHILVQGTVPCLAVLCLAVLCVAVLCLAGLCLAGPCCTVLCQAELSGVVHPR